ncbi:RDD family protein [Flexithrix dorotheae]|uniref:RDD family protein n=1 Tax=Flexithrix dorotheae TaxID=70993 RepID=UPI00036F2F7F|nr:RDD family protein [Flexithrix dorotheae]
MNKTKSKNKKQFDVTRAQVDPKLQGAKLASFQRRSLAYILDWAIILLATKYLWFTVLAGMGILYMSRKLNLTIKEGRRLLNRNLHLMDEKLEEYEIEEKVRRGLGKYTKYYVYGFIIFLVGASVLMAIEIVFGTFIPDDFKLVIPAIKEANINDPIDGMNEGLKLFSRAVGGVVYFSFFTWKWRGQTPAKRLMGIRVVRLNGLKLRLWDSVERVSGYTASAALFLMGFFQYFWDINHQTTHDKISETIVIIDDREAETEVGNSEQTFEEEIV